MGRIVTRNRAIWLQRQQASGTTVAACGCFDIFHVGHLDYLEGAARLGTVLFVGVNTDESIRRLKGRDPRFVLADRMRVLAALTCVDYVFAFPEDTFAVSLAQLHPSILARGVDADSKGFPERAVVQYLNIAVEHIGTCKRASSRNLRPLLPSYKKTADPMMKEAEP